MCFTNGHSPLARVHTQTLAAPAVRGVQPKLSSLQNVRPCEGRLRATGKGPALRLQRRSPRPCPPPSSPAWALTSSVDHGEDQCFATELGKEELGAPEEMWVP